MYHQLWESAKGKSFGPSKGGSVYNLSFRSPSRDPWWFEYAIVVGNKWHVEERRKGMTR